jgi:hypothetical protein
MKAYKISFRDKKNDQGEFTYTESKLILAESLIDAARKVENIEDASGVYEAEELIQ